MELPRLCTDTPQFALRMLLVLGNLQNDFCQIITLALGHVPRSVASRVPHQGN